LRKFPEYRPNLDLTEAQALAALDALDAQRERDAHPTGRVLAATR